MNNKIVGKVINNKIDYKFDNTEYLDDKDIFIGVEGRLPSKGYLKVLKKSYFELGEKFLSKIPDYFSIYLYDKKNNKLILTRDRIGLKQIYYYSNDKGIYFSRDLMDLMNTYKIKKNINIDSLSLYFRYLYIVPPETIFNDVYKLNNGSYVVYENNQIKVKTYYNIIDVYNKLSKNASNDFDNCKKELHDKLYNCVKNNISNQSNIGVYLSSGIDSSLVTALCCKCSKKKINTFSIGVNDSDINEASDSKKIANYLNTNHHELYIDKDRVLNTIKKLPLYYTEPFADQSGFAYIILNEFAKDNNITLAAVGDGADQMLCGLSTYDTLYKTQNATRLINPLHLNINNKFIKNNRKLTYIFNNSNKKYYSQCDITYIESFLDGLFKDTGRKRLEEEKVNSNNWQVKRMMVDLTNQVADRLNTKSNNVSYNNNINIFSPFVSREVMECTFKISHNLKYHNKIRKYILKEILYDYVPKEYFGGKKKGFSIPSIYWLKNYLYKDLKRVSTKKYLDKQNIFNYDVVKYLIDNIDNKYLTDIIWCFYMFQLWYEKYMG